MGRIVNGTGFLVLMLLVGSVSTAFALRRTGSREFSPTAKGLAEIGRMVERARAADDQSEESSTRSPRP